MRKGERNLPVASRNRNPASKGSPVPPALMNLGEIKELIDLIIEKGISEFELERDGVRIRIGRNAGPTRGLEQRRQKTEADPNPDDDNRTQHNAPQDDPGAPRHRDQDRREHQDAGH
jgi:hypothetical protein